MLKKLLTNKIVLICCGVLIAGIVICLVIGRDSKVHQEENHQIEQEETEQDDTGLEVKDDVDGTVDSVDGSGSWDDTSDNNDQKTQTTPDSSEQKTETTPGNNAQKTDDDTENNNNNNNSNNNTADDRDEIDKQENILEDDKEWSGIS